MFTTSWWKTSCTDYRITDSIWRFWSQRKLHIMAKMHHESCENNLQIPMKIKHIIHFFMSKPHISELVIAPEWVKLELWVENKYTPTKKINNLKKKFNQNSLFWNSFIWETPYTDLRPHFIMVVANIMDPDSIAVYWWDTIFMLRWPSGSK